MRDPQACIAAHPDVLKQPPPAVQLTEFGASALSFEIFCIVPNLPNAGGIKSEIQLAILRRFRAAGIDMTPAAGCAADRSALRATTKST